ncbi:glutamate synthase (NADPH) GltB3 subunit [Acetanaerobacterium elongatum]|uniref:Glutamate synthase (NADPH) GltB3 subunit n=2 Tax=Acetanaerobacterium elongatum TaxID=258515 RepID=A0A1G9XUL2_9FIRM|nr:glutamate synthase (NADPH) GltB3 subunit [Acetanaerobacterium elongatum]
MAFPTIVPCKKGMARETTIHEGNGIMKITAGLLHFQLLNEQVRETTDAEVVIDNCIGQRYIGSGLGNKHITINGVPGNALGAYLNGATIEVNGNAQDATGDTMNDGRIIIHGSSGDATGYAMRGGRIYVQGNAGYRAGIHMKAYKEKLPVLIIGGKAGSFLGEYQAGGLIVVLGLRQTRDKDYCSFCGTGMHGGKIFLRTDTPPEGLPKQVTVREATVEDLNEIAPYIDEFCAAFGESKEEIIKEKFLVLVPDTKNPYKQLYTHN